MKSSLQYIPLAFILAVCSFCGCKKEETNGPISPLNEAVPGVVSNITVVNLPAQSRLTYTLPESAELSYVKAVYTLKSGATREVKASAYTNILVCDGFGDTLEHVVKLYCVSKSEVVSAAVSVTIKPLENPIWGVFRNLKVFPDFAGFGIQSVNSYKGFDVAIIPFIKPLSGPTASLDFKALDGIYTSTDSIKKTIRGLDTVPTRIMIYVRDRFLNSTDTFYTTLSPYYETALSKSKYNTFSPVILPGDIRATYSASGTAASGLTKMWDGNVIDFPSLAYTPANDLSGPHCITFDVGQLARMSRIVIWDYPEFLTYNGFTRMYYYGGDMKNFEVWGSAVPSLDGSWASWTLLGDFTSIKPSGGAYATETTEDYNTAAAGLSYSFNANVPKFRYLRIKCKSNWRGTYYLMISEVQVYGDPR